MLEIWNRFFSYFQNYKNNNLNKILSLIFSDKWIFSNNNSIANSSSNSLLKLS